MSQDRKSSGYQRGAAGWLSPRPKPDEALQYILSLQKLHIKKVEKLVAKGVRSKVQLLILLKEHAETLSRAAALPFALEQVRAQRHEL